MAGPSRLRPPTPAERAIRRPRLLEVLAERWIRRLVTVVAGPGFGKTSLLVAAVADGGPRDDDEDVWLSCAPQDADAVTLLADLGAAFGIDGPADLEAIVRTLWLRAPVRICLVLDDAHELTTGSTGRALMARLIDELPGNVHLVLASREAVPGPLARLAARGQLARLAEEDLLFDRDELATFAVARRVDVARLGAAAGWPALTEMTATAADDLVFDYVWEEVLTSIGPERARVLAQLALVGGGDDEVVAALEPGAGPAEAVVRGVPLVERRPGGWVVPHSLWHPVLERLLSEADRDDARDRAARVHRDAGRFDDAIRLFGDAESWDEVIATIQLVCLSPVVHLSGLPFDRWHARLPAERRDDPIVRFAEGMAIAAHVPSDADAVFLDAAAGFRTAGDVEGEVSVIQAHGRALWWANDVGRLLGLHQRRATELAETGSPAAVELVRIGNAAIAHIGGDSDGVLAALDGVDERRPGGWGTAISWFRHVAYRRRGDLVRAEQVVDQALSPLARDEWAVQLDLARTRTRWLRGEVDDAIRGLRTGELHYRTADHRYLHVEVGVELAAHLAWLGDTQAATLILNQLEPDLAAMPGALTPILQLIARASIALVAGAEETAAGLLADEELAEAGRDASWYWTDRAAVALVHVLRPDLRLGWEAAATAPAHRPGVQLARLLEDVRAGDTSGLASFNWPEPGLARVHLPLRWLAELVAAAQAIGHPPPDGWLDAAGPLLPAVLDALPAGDDTTVVEQDAGPALALRVLGPLELRRGPVPLDHPDLRRRRVRELLCVLVVQRRARRDLLADTIWPNLANGRHNLRVTLNYLQDVLGPGVLRADKDTVGLVAGPHLRCDLWDLADHLDAADRAERSGDPAAALAAYDLALPLWGGPPYDDVAGSEWVGVEQVRWTIRYVAAAVRAGELHLAGGSPDRAVVAAEQALVADPSDERAYQLLARAHLVDDNPQRARQALDACLAALSDLGVGPSAPTVDLLAAVAD